MVRHAEVMHFANAFIISEGDEQYLQLLTKPLIQIFFQVLHACQQTPTRSLQSGCSVAGTEDSIRPAEQAEGKRCFEYIAHARIQLVVYAQEGWRCQGDLN